MDEITPTALDAAKAGGASAPEVAGFRPAFQVIALDCEITAYAPDEGDDPLF